MRGLTRLYIAVSAMTFALALGGAAFLAAAAWIVPEWTREAARGVSRALSDFAGPGPAPVTPGPGARMEEERAGGESEALGAVAPAVHHEESPPCEPDPGARALSELAEKIEAWETLREPILALLAALPGGMDGVRGASDIRLVAARIGARLEAAASSLAERRGPVESADPRTLARILLDERAMSDDEAATCLGRLSPARASEVIERVSRLAPERAGRLLRALEAREAQGTTARGS